MLDRLFRNQQLEFILFNQNLTAEPCKHTRDFAVEYILLKTGGGEYSEKNT